MMTERSILEIENACKLTSTVYAWLRNDISQETGYRYWRDIHGTLVARIPGKCIYRQLHLSHVLDIFSEKFRKVKRPVELTEQINGIAHSYYTNEEQLSIFRQHRFTKTYLLEDEPNLVRMNASLWSANDNAHTLKDLTGTLAPQGKPVNDEYVISFIFEKTVPAEVRKANIVFIAQSLTRRDEVLRVRYHLLEEYDDENIQDTQVSHHRPFAVRYNAWIELAFKPNSDVAILLEPLLSEIMLNLDTIHLQPIFEKYTIVAESKPTVVGLKGFPAYQTILVAGAQNQLSEKLLSDIYDNILVKK